MNLCRLFGTTGFCAACGKNIPAFEMVMRAKGNVYHLECFGCSHCNHRFCVGDKFYLSCDNKILCEYDYEERLLVASLTAAPSCPPPVTNKRSNLQVSQRNVSTFISFWRILIFSFSAMKVTPFRPYQTRNS